MPLHDWTDRRGWDGVHHLWITELLRWVKPRLPTGYRAYRLGSDRRRQRSTGEARCERPSVAGGAIGG